MLNGYYYIEHQLWNGIQWTRHWAWAEPFDFATACQRIWEVITNDEGKASLYRWVIVKWPVSIYG